MQYSGIHINAVTYVIIVMAIGLLVDFLVSNHGLDEMTSVG